MKEYLQRLYAYFYNHTSFLNTSLWELEFNFVSQLDTLMMFFSWFV